MTLVPETRPSLLIRLKDPWDLQAWEDFVGIYRPVILRLAKFRGLQHSDAEDLAQQVLLSISKVIPEWQHDPQRARFRTWLRRVVGNAAINALTRRRGDRGRRVDAAPVSIHDTGMDEPADQHFLEQLELESRRETFRRAADDVRDEFHPDTWEAFWLTAVEGLSAEEAGSQIGKSAGAVYVARSRVVRRLQKKVQELEGGDA